MSKGNVLSGAQLVWKPVTWPSLQMGPSARNPPAKPTGHTDTFCVERI